MWILVNSAPLAAIDIESIIIGLVIFGSIVGKIMKATKSDGSKQKGASARTRAPSASPSKRISNAQSELEAFLSTLNNAAAPQKAQAAPPPPPPVPRPTERRQAPPRPPTVRRAKPQYIKQTTLPKVHMQAPAEPDCDERDHTDQEVSTDLHAYCESSGRSAFAESIGDDLINKQSIRKAIILREILGPPVALRTTA